MAAAQQRVDCDAIALNQIRLVGKWCYELPLPVRMQRFLEKCAHTRDHI